MPVIRELRVESVWLSQLVELGKSDTQGNHVSASSRTAIHFVPMVRSLLSTTRSSRAARILSTISSIVLWMTASFVATDCATSEGTKRSPEDEYPLDHFLFLPLNLFC
jgi:hypothetical protein